MFGKLLDVESWAVFARQALVGFALITLVPALVITLIVLALIMAPAALVGIPFMVPALFPGVTKPRTYAARSHGYPLIAVQSLTR